MTCYPPADISGYTDMQLVTLFSNEGGRTGFGFYDSATPPGNVFFVDATSFYNLAAAEGFFTGCLPKKYYSPRQVTAIAEADFYDLLREEGITTGDFAAGVVCHSPGEAECDILANMAEEGYQTGCPEVIAAADPALTDFGCEDGRCYGTCCVAPDAGVINVTIDDQTEGIDPGTPVDWSDWQIDSVVLEYPCDTRVSLALAEVYLSGDSPGSFDHEIQIDVNGVPLVNPYTRRFVGDNTVYSAWFSVITIAANTPTTIELKGRHDAGRAENDDVTWDAFLYYQAFKESCV